MFDIPLDLIQSFLESTVGLEISDLAFLGEGMFSEAYSLKSDGTDLILRINPHFEDFAKDNYAYHHYRSPSLPIPRMVKMGAFGDGFYFAITERCPGTVSNIPSTAAPPEAEPSLFEALEAISKVDISATEGYGLTDGDGKGRFESWNDYLTSFYNHKFDFELRALTRTSFLESDLVDRLLEEFEELLPFAPLERYLCHGDIGFDNVVTRGPCVTGVLDWAESGYGDHLYDIAYLDFWSVEPISCRWLDWTTARGRRPRHFEERMRLYQLHIGIGSLATEVLTGDKPGYDRVRQRTLSILEPGRRRPTDWQQ